MSTDWSPEEQIRLDAVAACAMMDSPREAAFDNIVFTAAQLFRVPMAMLAIVGQQRIWLKASVGPFARELDAGNSLCTAVIHANDLLVVEDTTADSRFAKLGVVIEQPGIRFYAGVPLHGARNAAIATLCVLDRHPRTVPDRARSQLLQLAREAEALIRLRSPRPI